MSVLTLRTAKGSRLTFDEGDDNFEGLASGALWNMTALAGKAVTFASMVLMGGLTMGDALSTPQVNTNFIDGGAAELVIRAGDSGVNLGKIKFGQNNSYGSIALANNAGTPAARLMESSNIYLLTEDARTVRFAFGGSLSNVGLEVGVTTPVTSWLKISGSPAGVASVIEIEGANKGIWFGAKGIGSRIYFASGADQWDSVEMAGEASDPHSQIWLKGGIGSDPVVITAEPNGNTPTPTDIGIKLLPYGTEDIHIGKALVALGGGSAPTLGTIGGSGPAVAGQNSWMRFKDSAGVACWLPVWK